MKSIHRTKRVSLVHVNYFLFIAFILLANTCCNQTNNESNEIAFEVLKSDNGKTFTANLNDEFNVALEECVGCADVWTIAKQDSSKIRLEDKSSRDRSCSNCVGGNLTRVFRFKCIALGQSDLELTYFDDTVKITIKIQ